MQDLNKFYSHTWLLDTIVDSTGLELSSQNYSMAKIPTGSQRREPHPARRGIAPRDSPLGPCHHGICSHSKLASDRVLMN